MSIESRIVDLERMIGGNGDAPLEAVPAAWVEFNEDGSHVGPAVGEHVTPGQARVLHQIALMDDCVPFCEP